MLLTLTLYLSYNSFSQIDTSKVVILEEKVARAVIKDLLEGDQAKEEVQALLKKAILYQDKTFSLERSIMVQEDKIANLEKINQARLNQLKLSQDYITGLEIDLHKLKRKAKYSKVIVGVGLTAVGLHFIR